MGFLLENAEAWKNHGLSLSWRVYGHFFSVSASDGGIFLWQFYLHLRRDRIGSTKFHAVSKTV